MTRYVFKLSPYKRLTEILVLFYRPSMEMKRNLVEVNTLLLWFSMPPNYWLIIRENYTRRNGTSYQPILRGNSRPRDHQCSYNRLVWYIQGKDAYHQPPNTPITHAS
jgi:hypothetical protein